MSNFIVMDCETAALPIEQLNVPEFTPDSRLKDEVKIKADLEKKKSEWLESCALRAESARVLVIGFLDQDGQESFLEGEEKGILELFWKVYSEAKAPMVGHYIKGFDIPMIIRRSWLNGIVPRGTMAGRYLNPDRFIDTMEAWQCGNNRDTISLDNLSKALKVGAKNGEGKDFALLYSKDREAALSYLRNDLRLTQKCASRMGLI